MLKKALIIDDEPALCEIIVEVLKSIDIKGYTATSGKAAIKISIAHDHFDLIMVDMNMPEMNGENTYNKLAVKHPTTPLVFMSGYDFSAELKTMNLSCPNTFLKKPFTIAELATTVSKLLD